MRVAFASVVFAALAAATPAPAGVSTAVSPAGTPPPGCSPDYNGQFGFSPTNVTQTGKKAKRQASTHNALGIMLKGGIMTDTMGRTGYVAANSQLQFDDPPQAGAKYTSGFSVCQNGSLALGSDVIWWRCLSGASTTSTKPFYNLYYTDGFGAPVCIESYILAVGLKAGDGPGSPNAPESSGTVVATTSASFSMPNNTMTANGTMATGSMSMSSSSMSMTGGMSTATAGSGATMTMGGNTASASASMSASASPSASTGDAASLNVQGALFSLVLGLLAFGFLL